MPEERKLPNLPGSTDEDLKRNEYHGFFKKTTRQVWEEAEINHYTIEEHPKCIHYFLYTEDGVTCKKCHMGLIGKELTIRDGRLFWKDQELFERR